MLLNALVLESDVKENVFYDQMTGTPRPGYSVELTVLDVDTKEKYVCRVNDGITRLEEIKQLSREGQPADVLAQVVDQLRQELPPEMSRLPLEVLKLTGKSAAYIRLVCRFAQVAAAI